MAQPIAVVLAAGKGTRMKSDLPKVLCEANGRPLIDWVLDALEAAGVQQFLVVVGYEADRVKKALQDRDGVKFVLQDQQLGTGHAVKVCEDHLEGHDGPVLIVAGDSPMIQPESIRSLLDGFETEALDCLLGTLLKDNPQGLGRIVRDKAGRFEEIVEEKDATDEQRAIQEVNMSTYLFRPEHLLWALGQLKNNNRQGEFYLTDCPAILLGAGRKIDALPVLKPCEALSVNTVDELAEVEIALQKLAES
ncbi:MAG: NTP transferase domain-containing protein [Planctomycetota bacterium]|jgi:bifunctional UDP-N-acetylglucosamine pyrophosphorylase/glucosamine-1-phosphate N-acetyltransferase/UDP-N-acetylglucosamine pyrophosphorylase|nr:NTP transferase domain-containing protein [Planctomycetota bacterium]MEC7604102.1 NTP transferase domain-containing protein [Planctomycetota bacterium]MEC7719281.1 NTP transferase domain-containing protein [Planctomycetota bacterium]MEE3077298.1 NTP transferase domain-containing protein [Planctomycetota bacterium]